MSNLIITLLFILMTLALILSLQLESLSLIIIITIILLILYIVVERKHSSLQSKKQQKSVAYYFKKQLMTDCEYEFYNKIKILEEHFKIVPQVNLAAIIKKMSKQKFQNELFRNIDFAIFTKDYSKLLLLIELNDKTHNQEERKNRDQKVKMICKEAGIKLICFYTTYSNEKEYVVNRILNEIEKQYIN